MAPKWFVTLSFWINEISYIHFMSCATLYAALLFTLGYSYSALVFFFTMLFVLGTVGVLKLATRVERPVDCLVPLCNARRAFPSGHSAAAAFVGTMVPYTLPFAASLGGMYTLNAILFVFVLVVALSRLTLRAHTPFQVAAGLAIGVVVPILAVHFIDPPLVDWVLTLL